jgi:hypothetical protein
MGELIAAGSALVLFIVMFIPWYGYTPKGTGGRIGSGNRSAWQAFAFIDIILFLVILAALGLAVLAMTQRSVALPISPSVIVTALGGLAVLLILYRILSKPDVCAAGFCAGDFYDKSLKIGVFLGLLSAAGITLGGYLTMQEEGTSFGSAADQLRSGGSGGQGVPPPAAPPPAAPPAGEAPPPPAQGSPPAPGAGPPDAPSSTPPPS